MKSERLMGLISEIDPELIESADVRPAKMKIPPMAIGLVAAAACVAVIVSVGYYAKTAKNRTLKQADDIQSISSEPVVTYIANYISEDTPVKKVDVEVINTNSYGITLNLTVNNKEDYDKYYTYTEYTVYKISEDGKDPVPVVTIDPEPDHYMVAPEIDTEVGNQVTINAKQKISLEEKETHMSIIWIDKYGFLENGEYYIEIKVYNEDSNMIPVSYELPFAVDE